MVFLTHIRVEDVNIYEIHLFSQTEENIWQTVPFEKYTHEQWKPVIVMAELEAAFDEARISDSRRLPNETYEALPRMSRLARV